MKPPPRTRSKPRRKSEPVQTPAPQSKKWKRTEQMKLLDALKKLGKTSKNEDIDCAVLQKSVRTRSVSEIQSVVESLKDKVISHASFKYKKKRWEEKKARKPIELWTHMASSLAGTLEQTITSAFSQMLIVSSTEPRTLKNCDPPEMHRLPPGERPAGRTVPWRPMAHLPNQGGGPGTITARRYQVFKTPAPIKGTAVNVPNSRICPPQQELSAAAGTSPAASSTSRSASCQPVAAKVVTMPLTSPQTVTPVTGQAPPTSSPVAEVKTISLIQNTQQPLEQHPPITTTTTTTKTTTTTLSTSSSPQTPLSISLTPAPRTALSSVASFSSATSCRSTPAAPTGHARLGRTSKSVTKAPPRMLGVKYVVDFEKIYRYLSAIHKPNDECCLTPMESAIVLDLLMSLPEELPLLDCKKLHKHLIQVHQCLSSPADSKMAKEMLKQLKDGLDAQTEAASGRDSQPDTAGTAGTEVTNSGGRRAQPDGAESQSSSNDNTSSKSGDTDVMGLCPPLNPFMVPLKLLMRR